MKRIEAFIQDEKLSPVVDSIKEAGVGGLTILQAKGQGAGNRPLVTTSRGTSRQEAEFDSVCSIVTVVEDAKADRVVSAIAKAAGTNSKGDGKIFVSPVEDVLDICTENKGASAL